MKSLDFPMIERVARSPEGRERVQRLLELSKQGLEKANDGLAAAKRALTQAEENVRFFTRDVESSTVVANRFQSDTDRLEQILRDSAGELAA